MVELNNRVNQGPFFIYFLKSKVDITYVVVSVYLSSLSRHLRPRQNGHHFPDDNFETIVLKENYCILIQISLKFDPKGPIFNKLALVKVMAWCQTGDKRLLESIMVYFTNASINGLVFLALTHWYVSLNLDEFTSFLMAETKWTLFCR